MSSKTLTFYTSTSSATRRLRTPVQIVLTLSLDKPVTHRNSKQPHEDRTMEPQLPIAWQVLQFDLPNSPRNVSVDYIEEFGVTEVVSEINGVYQPGLSSSPITTGKLVKYSGQSWSTDTLQSARLPHKYFAIHNNAKNAAEIALCSYSPNEQDEQQPYIPVVLLGSLDSGFQFLCTTPIYLQAYSTVSHKRGQRLTRDVIESNVLFKDLTGKPEPKLLSDLKRNCTLQVFSLPNGEITVEITSNRD
ncbi:hypothetical protein B0H19DRAFT_1173168 [Mycena capillaripes]|nr:hypothetical protein B0H19DRAFT_1173168 [Mycena capillaripes]